MPCTLRFASQVWASIKRDSGAGYAIKVMGRRRVVGKKAESHLLSELRCMQQVSSSFVCSLHYAYATPDSLCLVLEWLRGGSLQYHLKRRRAQVERRERLVPFDETEVCFYAGCILLTMCLLSTFTCLPCACHVLAMCSPCARHDYYALLCCLPRAH